MENIKIGVIGASEIAFRRFLPSLKKCKGIEYIGIASRNLEKTKPFVEMFGGRGYASYEQLLEDDNINAVYIPLPPALHYEWGKKVLESGKHVFMEKPFTTNEEHTCKLIDIAMKKNLVIHENYMFLYHSQLEWIENYIGSGVLGEIRAIRSSFCFPKRATNDFRYDKTLGGGALLDCGGYPVRLAFELLGSSTKVVNSRLNYTTGIDVDVFGSVTLENNNGIQMQITFGMDNNYKCNLEINCSKGELSTDRIFTAPVGFEPIVNIHKGDGQKSIALEQDDSFRNSIAYFINMINKPILRNENLSKIKRQSIQIELIEKRKYNDFI